jgi:hypothetical protein
VLVDPEQAEALARFARRLAGWGARSTFVVASLDAEAPLPRLEPADPPRFEIKRLEPPAVDWGPALEPVPPGGTHEDQASETSEGSDS